MNRNYASIMSKQILAHEFGHVIGLRDLYQATNKLQIMYGYTGGSATAPSVYDKAGAKMITGQHTTHTWGYIYYDTSSGTNRHIKYCSVCYGRAVPAQISSCTYNANNICTACGVKKGTTPT